VSSSSFETRLTSRDLEHIFSAIDHEDRPSPGLVGETDASMEGFLYKLDTSGVMKQWRKRWFSLQRTRLLYYKSAPKKSTPPLGFISIIFATKIGAILQEKKRKPIFEIVTPEKTYQLQATSTDLMIDWVCALKEAKDRFDAPKDKLPDQDDKMYTVGGAEVKSERGIVLSPLMDNSKSGTLEVLVNGKYKKRFFELKGGILSEHNDGKIVSNVPLYGCAFEKSKSSKKFCFEISTPGSSRGGILLKAESEEEMLEWLSVLQLQKVCIENTLSGVEL